jgi:hypothetical protein
MAATYNDDIVQTSRLCPILTVTGVSASTSTTKWPGGRGVAALFSTSGTSGFSSGVVTLKATPDDTKMAYTAVRSDTGGTIATSSDAFFNFMLPKGYTLRADIATGTTNSNVSVGIYRTSSLDDVTT